MWDTLRTCVIDDVAGGIVSVSFRGQVGDTQRQAFLVVLETQVKQDTSHGWVIR